MPTDYLQTVAKLFLPYMELSESRSEVWTIYLEARRSYGVYRGCCTWEEYLDFCLAEGWECAKRRHNQRARVVSRFSVDQPINERGETAGNALFAVPGDFTEQVAMGAELNRLPERCRKVAYCLGQGDGKEEILRQMRMENDEYSSIIDTLQQALRDFV